MKWGSMTRQVQELSGQGERRGLSTLDQSAESRWEVVEPVVWRYVEVMEFFPPKGYSHSSIGDPGLIPGLGRSAEEAIGYPLQYSWASLVAQLIKESACNARDLGSIPGL